MWPAEWPAREHVTPSALLLCVLATTAMSLFASLLGPIRTRKVQWQTLVWRSLGHRRNFGLVVSKVAGAIRSLSVNPHLWWHMPVFLRGRQPHFRVLLIGLDNAGKSTLCRVLSRDSVWPGTPPRPNHHVLHHQFQLPGCILDVIDPSHPGAATEHTRNVRRQGLWEELFGSRLDAIIFVVDASDIARLPEASDALHWVLRHPAVARKPVVVLGNKVDCHCALDSWELQHRLGLAGLSQEQREVLLERTSDRQPLPLALREYIASFHAQNARSPPHGGPLEVQMCSLARRWPMDAGEEVVWLARHAGADEIACRGSIPMRFFRHCGTHAMEFAVCVFGNGSCLSRQAALLPLHQA